MKKHFIAVLGTMVLFSGCKWTSEEKPEMKDEKITSVDVGQVQQKQEDEMFTKTESGLKYKILKAAPEGAEKPASGSTAVVHYTGWLEEDGKEGRKFDSSVDRGQPFKFQVGIGQVIKGWDEGVLNMKVGEKCRFIIPPGLGYGARGAGGVIPGNATLIFDVELLDIE